MESENYRKKNYAVILGDFVHTTSVCEGYEPESKGKLLSHVLLCFCFFQCTISIPYRIQDPYMRREQSLSTANTFWIGLTSEYSVFSLGKKNREGRVWNDFKLKLTSIPYLRGKSKSSLLAYLENSRSNAAFKGCLPSSHFVTFFPTFLLLWAVIQRLM